MIYIGNRTMARPKLGTKDVKRIYLGNTLVWSDVVRIYYTLSGVTCNGVAQVDGGASFSATLTGETGKQVDPLSVVVMMGSTDITDTAYDWTTNTISIASVTDTVTITAVGITMDSAYIPLPYIETIDSSAKLPIYTNYYGNENTQMEIDVSLPNKNGILFGIKGRAASTSNSASNPRYYLYSSSGDNNIVRYYRYEKNSTNSDKMKVLARTVVSVDGDVITYTNVNGGTSTLSANSTVTSFTTNNVLSLFGFSTSANNSATLAPVTLYRWKIKESNVLIHEWVPCKRVSDGCVGIYDIVVNVVVDIKDATVAQGPTTT